MNLQTGHCHSIHSHIIRHSPDKGEQGIKFLPLYRNRTANRRENIKCFWNLSLIQPLIHTQSENGDTFQKHLILRVCSATTPLFCRCRTSRQIQWWDVSLCPRFIHSILLSFPSSREITTSLCHGVHHLVGLQTHSTGCNHTDCRRDFFEVEPDIIKRRTRWLALFLGQKHRHHSHAWQEWSRYWLFLHYDWQGGWTALFEKR